MLMRIVKTSKKSNLNIKNRSQCSIGCALEVHLHDTVMPYGQVDLECLKHMTDASDCALALYHLKGIHFPLICVSNLHITLYFLPYSVSHKNRFTSLHATPYSIPMKLFLSISPYPTTCQYPGH